MWFSTSQSVKHFTAQLCVPNYILFVLANFRLFSGSSCYLSCCMKSLLGAMTGFLLECSSSESDQSSCRLNIMKEISEGCLQHKECPYLASRAQIKKLLWTTSAVSPNIIICFVLTVDSHSSCSTRTALQKYRCSEICQTLGLSTFSDQAIILDSLKCFAVGEGWELRSLSDSVAACSWLRGVPALNIKNSQSKSERRRGGNRGGGRGQAKRLRFLICWLIHHHDLLLENRGEATNINCSILPKLSRIFFFFTRA